MKNKLLLITAFVVMFLTLFNYVGPANATTTVSGDYVIARTTSNDGMLYHFQYEITYGFTYDGNTLSNVNAQGSAKEWFPYTGGQDSGYPTITLTQQYFNICPNVVQSQKGFTSSQLSTGCYITSKATIYGQSSFNEPFVGWYHTYIQITILADGTVSWTVWGTYSCPVLTNTGEYC